MLNYSLLSKEAKNKNSPALFFCHISGQHSCQISDWNTNLIDLIKHEMKNTQRGLLIIFVLVHLKIDSQFFIAFLSYLWIVNYWDFSHSEFYSSVYMYLFVSKMRKSRNFWIPEKRSRFTQKFKKEQVDRKFPGKFVKNWGIPLEFLLDLFRNYVNFQFAIQRWFFWTLSERVGHPRQRWRWLVFENGIVFYVRLSINPRLQRNSSRKRWF